MGLMGTTPSSGPAACVDGMCLSDGVTLTETVTDTESEGVTVVHDGVTVTETMSAEV
mgnify:CR=1 FL=1